MSAATQATPAPARPGRARRRIGVGVIGFGWLGQAHSRSMLRIPTLFGDREFDPELVVCADTLCYFGNLGPVTAAFARSLRAGGHLVFSVERSEAEAFELHDHGRYSHGRDYVNRTLDDAGFEVLRVDEDTLRHELGAPVPSLIVTARRR